MRIVWGLHISQCKLPGGGFQKQGYKLSETASCKNFTPSQARHHYKFLKTRWLGNSRLNVIASSLPTCTNTLHTHLLGSPHHSTCTPGKPSGLSVHHAVPVEVVGGGQGGQQHQQLLPAPHQLAWPEPRPLIPRAQHRGVPPRHPPYSSYLPDDGRSCLHAKQQQPHYISIPQSSSESSSCCLLFQMTRRKSPRCEQTNLFGVKTKNLWPGQMFSTRGLNCSKLNMENGSTVEQRRTELFKNWRETLLLQRSLSVQSLHTLNLWYFKVYSRHNLYIFICLFVCLLVCLLEEQAHSGVDE